jgi:hypothetical protein
MGTVQQNGGACLERNASGNGANSQRNWNSFAHGMQREHHRLGFLSDASAANSD